jgi:hypothetical protein
VADKKAALGMEKEIPYGFKVTIIWPETWTIGLREIYIGDTCFMANMAPVWSRDNSAITETDQVRGIACQPFLKQVIRKIPIRASAQATLPTSESILAEWNPLIHTHPDAFELVHLGWACRPAMHRCRHVMPLQLQGLCRLAPKVLRTTPR